MTFRDMTPQDRYEMIDAAITRYRNGDIGATNFRALLALAGMTPSDIEEKINENREASFQAMRKKGGM